MEVSQPRSQKWLASGIDLRLKSRRRLCALWVAKMSNSVNTLIAALVGVLTGGLITATITVYSLKEKHKFESGAVEGGFAVE